KAEEKYVAAVEESVFETPQTAEATLALVHFAGVLAADRLTGEVTQKPVSDERDAYHQSIALAAVAGWLNDQAIHAAVQQERKAAGERRSQTDTMLRERCEALAADYDAPLPKGDAGLIAAIERARELEAREKAIHREFNITMEVEDEIFNAIVEPARDRLIVRIL